MIALFWLLLALSVSPFKSKNGLAAENAALRHQLIVLQRRVRGRVPDPAGRQHHVTCSHRWTASPLHPSLSFRYTQVALDDGARPLGRDIEALADLRVGQLFEHPASHHPNGWAPLLLPVPVASHQPDAKVRADRKSTRLNSSH